MRKNYTTIAGGHKARKRFGQNFLIDTKIIDRIVATIAPKAEDDLLEIGPGQGAMTLQSRVRFVFFRSKKTPKPKSGC